MGGQGAAGRGREGTPPGNHRRIANQNRRGIRPAAACPAAFSCRGRVPPGWPALCDARVGLVRTDGGTRDRFLPDGNGAELIRDLRRRNRDAIALVLTGSREPLDHARAVEAGAAHVLHKSAPIRRIVEAIRRLCAGEALMPPQEEVALLRLLGQERERTRPAEAAFAQLAAREREIVGLLAEGLGDRQIAARLGVGEKTVRNHMTALMDKLGVDSRLQVLVLASRHGLAGGR
jgi:DNA-binding NarL/FixJ family response regulator